MKNIYCSKFWVGFLFFIMMLHLFLTIISISVLVDNIASGGHNLFVLIIIIGGAKRIANFSAKMVPIATLLYLVVCIYIICVIYIF